MKASSLRKTPQRMETLLNARKENALLQMAGGQDYFLPAQARDLLAELSITG